MIKINETEQNKHSHHTVQKMKFWGFPLIRIFLECDQIRTLLCIFFFFFGFGHICWRKSSWKISFFVHSYFTLWHWYLPYNVCVNNIKISKLGENFSLLFHFRIPAFCSFIFFNCVRSFLILNNYLLIWHGKR